MIDSSNSRAAVQKSIKTHRTIHPEQPKCEIYKTPEPCKGTKHLENERQITRPNIKRQERLPGKNNGSGAALESRG